MSASTLEMVILCITISRMRRSKVCHFCRADLEKLLVRLAAPLFPRPPGFRCSFLRPLRGEGETNPGIRDGGGGLLPIEGHADGAYPMTLVPSMLPSLSPM